MLLHTKQTMPQIMKPMIINTQEAMQIVVDWQRWLVERGITARVSEEGFTSRNHSLEVLDYDAPCRTLIMYIDNLEVYILCFPDGATAQETLEEVAHIYACIDILPGGVCYESFGAYGNFVIMLPLNENSERIEPLITDFWSKQRF